MLPFAYLYQQTFIMQNMDNLDHHLNIYLLNKRQEMICCWNLPMPYTKYGLKYMQLVHGYLDDLLHFPFTG
jgi:hypothetical protein